MSRAIAKVSGGVGSYSAAKRYADLHGVDQLELLFTDTLCEDQDAYRFLIASSANIFGITLPHGFLPEIEDFPAWEDREAYKRYVNDLAVRTSEVIPQLHWISDGRDVFDVYEDERFLGNSKIDPCSKILKRQMADRWLRNQCDPANTVVIVGIDHEEVERFEGWPARGIRGLRARMADQGWTFVAPLCDWLISAKQRFERLMEEGLWVPRLNRLGFAHNNCGGFCCKGGQGHWKLMLRVFPERYAYAEMREQGFREKLGDVSMLKDRRGGETKTLPLSTLRTRELRLDEEAEMGACGCFFGDAA